MNILLIEQDEGYREEVSDYLQRAGFTVAAFPHAKKILEPCAITHFDVALLGIGPSIKSGLNTIKLLRHACLSIGIILLATKTLLQHRLAGLNEGADAYLVKPIDSRELIATIHCVMRRMVVSGELKLSSWRLFMYSKKIVSPFNMQVSLTLSEMNVLKILIANIPEATPRNAIAIALGRDPKIYDFRRLETVISRLRKKLETHFPNQGKLLIRASRNHGYSFVAPCDLVNQ